MSTLSNLYTNLKTLCSQWFYTKTEVDGEITDINNTIDSLEYSDIGGNYVNVDVGIQAQGLSEIIDGLVNAILRVSKPNNWKTVACTNGTTYGTLYVNEDIRMCHYRYYRTGYNFTSTSEITLHSGHIPSAYRPPMVTLFSTYDVRLIGAVKSNGDVSVQTNTQGSGRTINMSGVWHY